MSRPRQFETEKVLDSALHAFQRGGYESVSLQQLQDATGLARQSLYDSFGDKHALFVACLRRYSDARLGELAEALAQGPVKHAFRKLFESTLRAPEEEQRQGCLVMTSSAELGGRDTEVAEIAAASLRRQEEIFVEAVRRGVREHELKLTPRAAERLGRFLAASLQGLRALARVDPGSPLLADFAAVALRALD